MGDGVQSLTVLMVSDLKASQAFYQNVLGCEVTDFWAIRNDHLKLGFKLLQASDPAQMRPNRDENQQVWDTYAYTDDFLTLEKLFNEWTAKGAEVAQPMMTYEEDWGLWREFAVKDPDGYVLGVGSADKK